MNQITEFFTQFSTVSVIVRLVIAVIFGSIVGMERASQRNAAGIRTFALVCLGSALATSVGEYFAVMSAIPTDMTRIPGQILTGIGFLGAGTIIVTDRRQVKGLTTAAGLWVTAAMGIALGAGFMGAAIACFALVLFTNYILFGWTEYVDDNTRTMDVHLEIASGTADEFMEEIKSIEYFSISSVERSNEQPLTDGDITLRITADLGKKRSHGEVINEIRKLKSVHYAEPLSRRMK